MYPSPQQEDFAMADEGGEAQDTTALVMSQNSICAAHGA
jgi:hypothetical protein